MKKIILFIISILIFLYLNNCTLFYIEPDAPIINRMIKKGVSGFNIEWKKVAGAKEYIIYYGNEINNKDPSTFKIKKEVKEKYYICNDFTSNNIYHFAVKASNRKGTSDFSNVISIND